MRTIKGILVLIVLLVAQSTHAQLENSLLWKISGNGLEKPSYLYGTIHIMCPDELTVSEATKAAFSETEQLALELDMDEPNFMTSMQQAMVNPGMTNISGELSDEDRELLNTYFKENYGSDLTQLGVMKPFALMSMMFIKGLDCPQPGSYEATFIQMASSEGKETLGLESIQDQVGIFDKVETKEQLGWLVDYAKEGDAFRENLSKLMKAYKSEDLKAIYSTMDDYPEYAIIQEDLLDNRNKKWMEPMARMASEKSTFFAVGAAHLGGENGVINLLRAKGYTVEAVN
jgi:uncharacterized protein YbaP (TraB family)